MPVNSLVQWGPSWASPMSLTPLRVGSGLIGDGELEVSAGERWSAAGGRADGCDAVVLLVSWELESSRSRWCCSPRTSLPELSTATHAAPHRLPPLSSSSHSHPLNYNILGSSLMNLQLTTDSQRKLLLSTARGSAAILGDSMTPTRTCQLPSWNITDSIEGKGGPPLAVLEKFLGVDLLSGWLNWRLWLPKRLLSVRWYPGNRG